MSKGFTTQLTHADRLLNLHADGSVHSPINQSVLFEYADARDLVAVFQGEQAGHVYGRSSSPSALALQNMLNQLEGGIGCVTFATGMAAISATFLSLLKAGDHLIVSQYLFGNTRSLIDNLISLGIQVSLVDVTDVQQVAAAKQTNTKAVFLETIANPATQIADLSAIGQLCQQQGWLYLIDNTLTPANLFDGKRVQASLLITSLTKYIAGHGNVLGGSVIDTGLFDWRNFDNILPQYRIADPTQWGLTQLRKRGLRDLGATLSPQAAAAISVGMETLALRMQRSCENAMHLATFLQGNSGVKKVYYPGLAGHPQHVIAREYFSFYGAILSVDLHPNLDIFAFLNRLKLVMNATHLGDTRTLGLPVAHTIYHENGAQVRAQMGIDDNMIRFSIGIEDTNDLIADFEQALATE